MPTDPIVPPVTETPAAVIPPMPDGGDAKYYDPKTGAYSWANQIRELNFKLAQKEGKAVDPPPSVVPPVTPPPVDPTKPPVTATLEAAVERGEVDLEAMANEVYSTGKLSDANRAALKSYGIPDALINHHESTLKSRAEAGQTEAFTHLGSGDAAKGKEVWAALDTWAKANLKAPEIVEFNKSLKTEGWKAAIDVLRTRSGIGTTNPALLTGGNAAPAVAGFRNAQEIARAINAPDPHDPKKQRYYTDADYRASVQARIQAGAQRAA